MGRLDEKDIFYLRGYETDEAHAGEMPCIPSSPFPLLAFYIFYPWSIPFSSSCRRAWLTCLFVLHRVLFFLTQTAFNLLSNSRVPRQGPVPVTLPQTFATNWKEANPPS
jgi:hypothetical protein